MKPTTLTLIVAALLLAISASVAAEKPSTAQPAADKPAPAPAPTVKKTDANTKPAEKVVNVTGSYIKQKVDKHGVLASVGSSSLIIVDSETIRRTGASSIPELFRRGGWAR